MKKRFFCLAMVLLISFAIVAEAETVVKMKYTVALPDVIREGIYTGEVKNGVPHGYGVFEAINSDLINWHYVGEWVDGNMCGKGGQYWDNGESRVGLYESNRIVLGEIHTHTVYNYIIDRRTTE